MVTDQGCLGSVPVKGERAALENWAHMNSSNCFAIELVIFLEWNSITYRA